MSIVRNMILDGVALENNRLGISSMETSMIRGDEAVEFKRKKRKGRDNMDWLDCVEVKLRLR